MTINRFIFRPDVNESTFKIFSRKSESIERFLCKTFEFSFSSNLFQLAFNFLFQDQSNYSRGIFFFNRCFFDLISEVFDSLRVLLLSSLQATLESQKRISIQECSRFFVSVLYINQKRSTMTRAMMTMSQAHGSR